MYARQVEKDGIRRTLMTSSGCATERHFSKDDLKKLFVLSPKGECEMLTRIRNKDPNGVEGSSGKCSILEKHQEVVGLSSHDSVYTNAMVNLSMSDQSPFAGTPNEGRFRNSMSHHPTALTFESIVEEKLQSELPSKDTGTIANPTETKEDCVIYLEPQDEDDCIFQSKVKDSLNSVETMTRDGKIAESLFILMQLVESNRLQGKEKLLVHKKITSRLMFLGWE